MKASNIKAQNTKAKGKFLKVKVENSEGQTSFTGKVKKLTENYVTFLKVSGKKEEVKFHINSIKGMA